MRRALAALMLCVACSRETPTQRVQATPLPTPTVAPTPTPPVDPIAKARDLESPDAETLARKLAAAEDRIGNAEDVAAAARDQQAAYRQLVANPTWREPAIAKLPDSLRARARANVEAGAELRALTSPREALPPWRIVAPPAADVLLAAYRAGEAEFGVHWTYLAAIHLVESRMGRIRGTSIAGARGPMQFLPSTWEHYGRGDIEDPHDAIAAAGRYLKAHGAPQDMDRALFAYNRSRRYVRAVSLYADVMRDDERAYLGYHGWLVYYRTTSGDALLEEGYSA